MHKSIKAENVIILPFFMLVEAQNITHTPRGEGQVRLIRPPEISFYATLALAPAFFYFDLASFNVSIR